MSAIFAITSTSNKPISPDFARRMQSSQIMYGPDGGHTLVSPYAALGHQMLVTTRQDQLEQLPRVDPESGVSLTFDGRIDNREDLARSFGWDRINLHCRPDSDFVLQAYIQWGLECPSRLIGDFAFAIWHPSSRRLFCARDHQGLRPLYYTRNRDYNCVATDISSLLAIPDMPKQVNRRNIRHRMLRLPGDLADTIYQDILALPPGHSMLMEGETCKIQGYWQPNLDNYIKLSCDEEYAEAYAELLDEAIRCRLRSGHPISADLSGGLDSSTAVCRANRLLRNQMSDSLSTRLQTYSLALPEHDPWPRKDERERIDLIVKQEPVDHHYVLDGGGPLGMYCSEMFLNYSGYPLTLPPQYHKSLELRVKAGCRVNLIGQGGDELATGQAPTYMLDLLYRMAWPRLFAELRNHSKSQQQSIARTTYQRLIRPVLEQARLRKNWGSGLAFPKNHVASDRMVEEALREDFSTTGRPVLLPPLTNRQQFTILSNHDHYRERASLDAHFCVQSRLPFRDTRLVEYCLRVPAEQHRSGGWGRWLVRRTGEGILPPQVQWNRDKTGSTQPDLSRRLAHEKAGLLALTEKLADDSALHEFINFPKILANLQRIPDLSTAKPNIEFASAKVSQALGLACFLQKERLL